jgi:CreA protein
MSIRTILFSAIAAVMLTTSAQAETVGEVTTKFRFNPLAKNDKIVVEAFDDPKVDGVACYVSRAKTGGMSAHFGLAEDTSDASVACRQVGPIKFRGKIAKGEDGEDVFKQSSSWLFKTIQVVRHYDAKRNVLTYLVYSDKIIDGSPKNAITAVPLGDVRPE